MPCRIRRSNPKGFKKKFQKSVDQKKVFKNIAKKTGVGFNANAFIYS